MHAGRGSTRRQNIGDPLSCGPVPQSRTTPLDAVAKDSLGLGDDAVRIRPTTVFVPSVTVIGRSVLSRSVRHGTPSTVVSSWTPPESVSTSAGIRLKGEEVEVAERRSMSRTPAGQAEAVELDRGPRVDREDQRAARARRRRAPPRRDREGVGVVDVRRAVERDQAVAAGFERRGRASTGPGSRPVEVGEQRVDHDVADQVDPRSSVPLGPEVVDGVRRGREQEVAHAGR